VGFNHEETWLVGQEAEVRMRTRGFLLGGVHEVGLPLINVRLCPKGDGFRAPAHLDNVPSR
jgi:hypothetical protein